MNLAQQILIRPNVNNYLRRIGDLYDCEKEEFLSGLNILNTTKPNDFIENLVLGQNEISQIIEENFYSKFKKFDFDANISVSLGFDLINVNGSARFFNEFTYNDNFLKISYVIRITTIKENLEITKDGFDSLINYQNLENILQNSTHLASQIKYGANIIATFTFREIEDENKNQMDGIIGKLIETVSKITNGDNSNNNYKKHFKNSQIELYSDIHDTFVSTDKTLDDFKGILESIPERIKMYNSGKGVPIEYTLMPIKLILSLQNIILDNKIIYSINNILFSKASDLMDNLMKNAHFIESLLRHCSMFPDLFKIEIDEILKYNSYLQNFTSKAKDNLKKLFF